jgi:hypothetical protein
MSARSAARWVSVVCALLFLASPATAEPRAEAWEADPSLSLWPPGYRLALQDAPPADPDRSVAPAPEERRPDWFWTSIIASGAIVGSTLNSVLDGQNQSYHAGDEGWFGLNTHFSGADKASHFVDYQILAKELAHAFVALGHKPAAARWLGAGLSALTGLVTEIGDGSNRYGFSYEDLIMDVSGALTAALISAAGAEDLVGFRRGLVNLDDCCNFSNEIYTGDLHLSGLARRLGWNIGPLKYLYFSVTYHADVGKSREVGFEVGLNFKQMLEDLDVRRQTWWGYALHVVFDNVRFPYTGVGFRYDLDAGQWRGPNAGY